MLPKLSARTAEPGLGAYQYQHHQPEQTLLYRIIEQHYPAFTDQLAALVPKPRVNLTRFHGVFAPNNKYRALVTPAKRSKVKKAKALMSRK